MEDTSTINLTAVTGSASCTQRIRLAFDSDNRVRVNFLRRPPSRMELIYERLIAPCADVVAVDLEQTRSAPERFWGDVRRFFRQARLIAIVDHSIGAELAAAALACGVDAFVGMECIEPDLYDWVVAPREGVGRGRLCPAGTEAAPPPPTAKELLINTRCFRVDLGDKRICVSALEFGLLLYLARNEGRVVRLDELAAMVWKSSPHGNDLTEQVRKCVWRLRQKIEDDPRRPRFLMNTRGHGYWLANARLV